MCPVVYVVVSKYANLEELQVERNAREELGQMKNRGGEHKSDSEKEKGGCIANLIGSE